MESPISSNNKIEQIIPNNTRLEPERIAKLYDEKIKNSNNINMLLAKEDLIACNHNGILLPGETSKTYQQLITDEKSRLKILHNLELNTIRYGLLFLMHPDKTMKVLDAGCGGGGSAILINQTYGCQVEGFTLSPLQAEFATNAIQKYGCEKEVSCKTGDMMNLNIEDSTYDRIWACESTEHAPSLANLFKEFKRVAKNGARLVIFAWCAHDLSLKKIVDAHYLTAIKPFSEYLSAANDNNWSLSYQQDLTPQTASYWYLRSYPKECSDSESFMTPGFASNKIQYYMFCFDLKK